MLVQCVFCLHNWIRRYAVFEDEFDIWDDRDVAAANLTNRQLNTDAEMETDSVAATQMRDAIAAAMWEDYLRVRIERGL